MSTDGTHLLLEISGAQCDLVLLHAARIARSLGRHVVLPPARPVLVVLQVVGHELRAQSPVSTPRHALRPPDTF